jgi:hypothetical protein
VAAYVYFISTGFCKFVCEFRSDNVAAATGRRLQVHSLFGAFYRGMGGVAEQQTPAGLLTESSKTKENRGNRTRTHPRSAHAFTPQQTQTTRTQTPQHSSFNNGASNRGGIEKKFTPERHENSQHPHQTQKPFSKRQR